MKNVGTIFRTAKLYQWDIRRWKDIAEEKIDFGHQASRCFGKFFAWNAINKRVDGRKVNY